MYVKTILSPYIINSSTIPVLMPLLQFLKQRHEACFILNKHFTRLTTMRFTYNSCFLKLVHEPACTVISYGEPALYHTC